MNTEEKLKLNDRLEIAQTIVINMKNDFKLKHERLRESNQAEALMNLLLAQKMCDLAIAIGNAKMNVLEPEKLLSSELNKKGE